MEENINRLGLLSRTQVLNFQVQNYSMYIVKTNNPLQLIENHYMYYLIHTKTTVEGIPFEEVTDFFHTVVPDALWDYVLYSHINHFEQADEQLLEYLLHEINALIA
mgnify:CR=1 FL=1